MKQMLSRKDAAEGINRIHPSGNLYNEHGIAHRRGFTCQPINPIPDLRSGLDSSPPHSANSAGGNGGQRPPFQGQCHKNINLILCLLLLLLLLLLCALLLLLFLNLMKFVMM